jgi:hypothetical protein
MWADGRVAALKQRFVRLQAGTCLVFSNYQLVHRVLTMVNRGGSVANRDFVAIFVVDQRAPLPSTEIVRRQTLPTGKSAGW